jgi:hypothetical protein
MSDDAACAKQRRDLALLAMVQLSDVALASEKSTARSGCCKKH